MKKIIYIIFFISATLSISKISFAESQDCSQYSTKTFSGLSKYMRCKKGLPPKKNFFESLKIKKTNPDEAAGKEKLDCNEYSTKTLVGLMRKIRCKSN